MFASHPIHFLTVQRRLWLATVALAVVLFTSMSAHADILPKEERVSPYRGYWDRPATARIAEESRNLQRKQKDHQAYYRRGLAYWELGESHLAIDDISEARKLYRDPAYLNALAWILATAKDKRCRDGRLACSLSLQSFKEIPHPYLLYLDTLAATQAERGYFKFALSVQEDIVEASSTPKCKAYLERLHLYQRNLPYRDK